MLGYRPTIIKVAGSTVTMRCHRRLMPPTMISFDLDRSVLRAGSNDPNRELQVGIQLIRIIKFSIVIKPGSSKEGVHIVIGMKL